MPLLLLVHVGVMQLGVGVIWVW